MNFKIEILANFEFFGWQICQQTVHKIFTFYSHIQLKSTREGKTSYIQQEINSKSFKTIIKEKIDQ